MLQHEPVLPFLKCDHQFRAAELFLTMHPGFDPCSCLRAEGRQNRTAVFPSTGAKEFYSKFL